MSQAWRASMRWTCLVLAPMFFACSTMREHASDGSGGEGPIQAGAGGQLPSADGGGEQCGNGIDDDQNGSIDDGCSCTLGATQPCFLGPPEQAGIGACHYGTQTCESTADSEVSAPRFGACVGYGTEPRSVRRR